MKIWEWGVNVFIYRLITLDMGCDFVLVVYYCDDACRYYYRYGTGGFIVYFCYTSIAQIDG